MYCNFTKGQAFPLMFSRVSRQPKSCILQKNCFFSNGSPLKSLEMIGSAYVVAKPRASPGGAHLQRLGKFNLVRARSFSHASYGKSGGDSRGGGVKERKTLPWIAGYKDKAKSRDAKGSDNAKKIGGSGWEESANVYFSKRRERGLVDDKEERRSSDVGEPEKVRRSRDVPPTVTSWYSYNPTQEDENETVEDAEAADDPRWDQIQSRYRRFGWGNSERPEVRRWSNQENWGRKTWKEATESTVPKMVGEGVYGVGPVLAALTIGRREFYSLYVQENLDLSGNNKKKKDKKGIHKVLNLAEKLGLTVQETTKHDLNMVVDNRPHQGLVLDASPLEMVSIRELDPVLATEDRGPLWVALDEVTDPQNLGAIIRSAYFFGAAGVVLCAKNSAPLSGVVSKASAGALELVELRSCKNMMQFLTSSGDNGWRVLGGSVSAKAVPLTEVECGKPTILVLGNEGTGLRPLVERSCTQLIRIAGSVTAPETEESEENDQMDMGKEHLSFVAVESLNVSVATGVLLYHLVGRSNGRVG